MSPRQQGWAWAALLLVFVLLRVGLILADPSRFWAIEETYQADMALDLARGQQLEALPAYLYPLFAGGTLVDGLAVAALASVFGPSWWLLKGLALLIALTASAVLVATVRRAVGLGPALALGALLAWAPASMATLQMFLHGNHAESALPLALTAAAVWAFIERDRSAGGRARLAVALGLLCGFSVFFVYSHLVVTALAAGLLVVAPLPATRRLGALALAAAGFAVGLLPWVACRVFLGEPLRFLSAAGGPMDFVRALASPDGVLQIAEAFALLPWLGTMEGKPWASLLSPAFAVPGSALLWSARVLLLASLLAALGLGLARRVRQQQGWVLPTFFGAHGLGLLLLVSISSIEPRYAQQLAPDALVALVLVGDAARTRLGAPRWLTALVLAIPLTLATLDVAALADTPAPGLRALGDRGLQRFSCGRQTSTLQGFRRDELPGISLWLRTRSPSDADLGFGLGFPDSARPLGPRPGMAPPDRVEAAWTETWGRDRVLDRTLMLQGLGAAAVVRHGGNLQGALGAFVGSADQRIPYGRGATWMAEQLAR